MAAPERPEECTSIEQAVLHGSLELHDAVRAAALAPIGRIMNGVEIETRRLTAAEDFDAIGCMRVARILRQLVPVMQAAPPPPPEPPAAPAKPPSLAARIAAGEAPAVTNGHAAP